MRSQHCRPVALFSFLVLCLLPVAAEDQPAPEKKSCVIFTMQDLSPGAENAEFAQPITASVSAAIEVGGFSIIGQEIWSAEVQRRLLAPRALLAEGTALAVAKAVGADMAVTGYYIVQDEQIYISLQCWDVAAERLITGLQQKARFNLAFYSSLHDRVAAMLPDIRFQEERPQGLAATVQQLVLPEITFLSPDEGMEILLAGDYSIGVVTDGKLLWKGGGISPGTDLHVEKRKPGYHTSRQTVRAGREIRLSKLEKEHTGGVEVDWTWGQLAGLGTTLRGYLSPDGLFVFSSLYLFVQPPLTSAGSPIIHGDIAPGRRGIPVLSTGFSRQAGRLQRAGIRVIESHHPGPSSRRRFLHRCHQLVDRDRPPGSGDLPAPGMEVRSRRRLQLSGHAVDHGGQFPAHDPGSDVPMVRSLPRCLALLGLVLPLASCVFFVSAFPPTLTQVVARTDLSAVIPAANAQDYALYALTASPSQDFVLLMNRSGSTDPRVIVLDSSLHLIQTYTLSQLNGWGAFNGNGIMADAAGNIEIGNFGFSAGNLSTVGANPSWNANPSIFSPGFASPAAQRNDVNFQVTGGTTLGYTQYHWWSSSDFSHLVFHQQLGWPIQRDGGLQRR